MTDMDQQQGQMKELRTGVKNALHIHHDLLQQSSTSMQLTIHMLKAVQERMNKDVSQLLGLKTKAYETLKWLNEKRQLFKQSI